MFVDKSKSVQNGKEYTRYLLRESYREKGKVCKRTIMNLSPLGEQACEVLREFYRNQSVAERLLDVNSTKTVLTHKKSFGAIWCLYSLAEQLGLTKAFGESISARLLLWQVITRILFQGSRLSSVRRAEEVETGFLNLPDFTEDALYRNLDWVAENQDRIEDALFKRRKQKEPLEFFLYDVSSSYVEGDHNELADYGYNRDKKRGKKQIVFGLLGDKTGYPISVQVFPGNTNDVKTFSAQIEKAKKRFHIDSITYVGDRGMIKCSGQSELNAEGFHYITGLTRVQIQTLLKQKVIQLSFFDEELYEVQDGQRRLIMRRNPVRAEEIQKTRLSKQERLQSKIETWNDYLKNHHKAKPETYIRYANDLIEKYRLEDYLSIVEEDRKLVLVVNEEVLKEAALLDGCYCLVTDLPQEEKDKEEIHSIYKQLGRIERDFRVMKSSDLEVRPLFLRKKDRTRAHVFIVMLSLILQNELTRLWKPLNVTVKEGLSLLGNINVVEVAYGDVRSLRIPQAEGIHKQLLDLAGVVLPTAPPVLSNPTISTRKKLLGKRK